MKIYIAICFADGKGFSMKFALAGEKLLATVFILLPVLNIIIENSQYLM